MPAEGEWVGVNWAVIAGAAVLVVAVATAVLVWMLGGRKDD